MWASCALQHIHVVHLVHHIHRGHVDGQRDVVLTGLHRLVLAASAVRCGVRVERADRS